MDGRPGGSRGVRGLLRRRVGERVEAQGRPELESEAQQHGQAQELREEHERAQHPGHAFAQDPGHLRAGLEEVPESAAQQQAAEPALRVPLHHRLPYAYPAPGASFLPAYGAERVSARHEFPERFVRSLLHAASEHGAQFPAQRAPSTTAGGLLEFGAAAASRSGCSSVGTVVN